MPLSAEEPDSRRDIEQCKIAFVATISQILYSRRGFPPDCFQLLEPSCRYESLEEILSTKHGIKRFDIQHLKDQRMVVFLRRAPALGLARFLQLLHTDILPLIDCGDLAEFRINFQMSSTSLGKHSLKEYFNIACQEDPDGTVNFDVWRAGVTAQGLNTTGSGLLDLGLYLSRLAEWKDPVHWTLSMRLRSRLDAPVVGLWNYDGKRLEEANLVLSQRSNFSLERAAHLKIEPLPPKHPAASLSPSGFSHPPLSDISTNFEFINDPRPVELVGGNTRAAYEWKAVEKPRTIISSEHIYDIETANHTDQSQSLGATTDESALDDSGPTFDQDIDYYSENSSIPKLLPDTEPRDEAETTYTYASSRASNCDDEVEIDTQADKKQEVTYNSKLETISQGRSNFRANMASQAKSTNAKMAVSQTQEASTTKTASRLKPRPDATIKSQHTKPATTVRKPKSQFKSNSQANVIQTNARARLQHNPEPSAQFTVSSMGKTIGSKASQKLVPVTTTAKVPVTKRKPKPPSQLLVDTTLSQVKVLKKAENLGAPRETRRHSQRVQKPEQPTKPTESIVHRARKLIEEFGLASDSITSSRISSPGDLPRLAPNQGSSQPLTDGSALRGWFTDSELPSGSLHPSEPHASPPDADMTDLGDEAGNESSYVADEDEMDIAEFSQTAGFCFSPNTVRRRTALLCEDDLPTSDSLRAENRS
ncbi:hypothetical protein QBC43DRAFT_117626 [Cladorrhinum sp. PSN259]|nr:hypothetical protein QBC43DRAFT_117626 [Cladorrhinum sp. PSN259]